jgi:hypothetical protein
MILADIFGDFAQFLYGDPQSVAEIHAAPGHAMLSLRSGVKLKLPQYVTKFQALFCLWGLVLAGEFIHHFQ